MVPAGVAFDATPLPDFEPPDFFKAAAARLFSYLILIQSDPILKSPFLFVLSHKIWSVRSLNSVMVIIGNQPKLAVRSGCSAMLWMPPCAYR